MLPNYDELTERIYNLGKEYMEKHNRTPRRILISTDLLNVLNEDPELVEELKTHKLYGKFVVLPLKLSVNCIEFAE